MLVNPLALPAIIASPELTSGSTWEARLRALRARARASARAATAGAGAGQPKSGGPSVPPLSGLFHLRSPLAENHDSCCPLWKGRAKK
jgi:hypothetical protein